MAAKSVAKIDTLFMTKTAENPTLWGRTYLYSPYKGVPPRAELWIGRPGHCVVFLSLTPLFTQPYSGLASHAWRRGWGGGGGRLEILLQGRSQHFCIGGFQMQYCCRDWQSSGGGVWGRHALPDRA